MNIKHKLLNEAKNNVHLCSNSLKAAFAGVRSKESKMPTVFDDDI